MALRDLTDLLVADAGRGASVEPSAEGWKRDTPGASGNERM